MMWVSWGTLDIGLALRENSLRSGLAAKRVAGRLKVPWWGECLHGIMKGFTMGL